VAELGWTRKAIRTVLGVTPVTMRPPKGDIGSLFSSFSEISDKAEPYLLSPDDRVRAISLAMGMVPILWTSTPDGGKFDSFGAFMTTLVSLSGLGRPSVGQIGGSLAAKSLDNRRMMSSKPLCGMVQTSLLGKLFTFLNCALLLNACVTDS